MFRTCCWSVLILLPLLSISQPSLENFNPVFDKLDMESGLPSNNTNCITQDEKGYIWIGTAKGLVRYDGSNFKTYLHDSEDSTTISANAIRALFIDHAGLVWIGTTGGGLSVLDPQTDEIRRYQSVAENSSTISHNEILCIYEDSKHRVWVGTENGINLFHRKRHTFTRFMQDKDDPSSLGAEAVLSILETRDHTFWLGTWAGGLNMMNLEEKGDSVESASFRRFLHDPNDPHSISSNNIWKVFQDDENRIWLATFESGLNHWMPSRELDPETGFPVYKAVHFLTTNEAADFRNLSMTDIEQDEHGTIWLGSVQGIVYFSPKEEPYFWEEQLERKTEPVFNGYRPNNASGYDLPSDLVKDIFIGTDQMFWLCTNLGIATYLADQKFSPTYPAFDGFPEPEISAFAEENDSTIWIGTLLGGLFRYNMNSRECKRVTNPRMTYENFDLNRITALYKEGRSLWMGNGYGISKLDVPTNTFTEYHLRDKNGVLLTGSLVRSFCRDKNNDFWVATQNGLVKFENDQYTLFRPDPNDSLSIPDKIIMDIFEDQEDNLWIATSGEGMCRVSWNPEREDYVFQNYTIDESGISNVSSIINSVARFKDYFLIGTSNGILLFDPIQRKYFRDTQLVPEIQGYINSIIVDNEDHLWISMDDGLFCYFPEEKRLAAYDVIDGLSGEAFGYRSFYKNDKGRIFLGGHSGFNSFYGHAIPNDNTTGKVLITDLKIYGKSVKVGEKDQYLGRSILSKRISDTEALKLSYQHKAISLEFAMLDFTQFKKNSYSYMLENFDNDWQELKGQNSVTWSHLKPGRYIFKVRVKNKEGFWSPTTVLPITVNFPFWQKKWFIAIIFFSVLLGLWFYVDYSTQKVRSDRIKLEKLVEERTSSLERATQVEKQARAEAEKARREAEAANNAKSLFLANMSHEIRTPLNGVLGMVQLLADTELDQEQEEYIHTVQKSSESLLGVINDILDFSKIESNKLELEAISFNVRSCIEEVAQLYVAKVSETQIKLLYSVDYRIPATIVADEIRFKQILSNLISNALKFTQDGYVDIFIGLPKGSTSVPTDGSGFQLDVWVKDSGIGIPQEKQKQLFKAFSQADNSITRKYGGTGLGLAICHKLCQLMGGSIEVSSIPGKGSTFHFWLQTQVGDDLTGPIYQSFSHYHGKTVLTRFKEDICTFSMSHMIKGLGLDSKAITSAESISVDPEEIYCLLIDYHCWQKEREHWKNWQASLERKIPLVLGYAFGQPLGDSYMTDFDSLISYPLSYKTFTKNLLSLSENALDTHTLSPSSSPKGTLEKNYAERFPLKIMVAEDNIVNQKLIKRVLEKLGYHITMVNNGKLALETYQQELPELIFMDIQMPEMDGVTACQEIRGLSSTFPQPTIVAMTANAMKGDRETFLEAGMDEYISKPFKISDVKKVLQQFSQLEREKTS